MSCFIWTHVMQRKVIKRKWWPCLCSNYVSSSAEVYHELYISPIALYMVGRWIYFSLQWRHMDIMASQITDASTVCPTVCSGAHQRKHHSSASLSFVRGIHRWPVVLRTKGRVTRKCFYFMTSSYLFSSVGCCHVSVEASHLTNHSDVGSKA